MLHRFFFSICIGVSFCTMTSAESIVLTDSSFENDVLDAGAFVVDGPSYWRGTFRSGGCCNSDILIQDPPLFPNQDGPEIGNLYVNGDASNAYAGFWQDMDRIEEGTYDLTVGLAHEPGAEPTVVPFKIKFESVHFGGPTVFLDEFTFPVGTANSSSFTDVTASLTIPPGHPEIGRYLRPVLLAEGPDAGSNPSDPRASYLLDNVRLNLTPTSGTPESVLIGQPSFGPASSWNKSYGRGGSTGLYHPETPLFPSQEGDQLAALNTRFLPDAPLQGAYATLWQNSPATVEAGTFTLTVGVAHDPEFEPTEAPFVVIFESFVQEGNLENTGTTTFLEEIMFPVGSANSTDLTDLTATLEIPEGHPAIGETLRVQLRISGGDAGSNPTADDPRATYLVDNVRLDFESAGGSFLAADFNESGMVDGVDLSIWQGAYGIDAGADADGDNDSDGADFLTWQRQFGTAPLVASSTAIPEPTTMLLAVGSLISFYGLRRRGIL